MSSTTGSWSSEYSLAERLERLNGLLVVREPQSSPHAAITVAQRLPPALARA